MIDEGVVVMAALSVEPSTTDLMIEPCASISADVVFSMLAAISAIEVRSTKRRLSLQPIQRNVFYLTEDDSISFRPISIYKTDIYKFIFEQVLLQNIYFFGRQISEPTRTITDGVW